MNKVLVIFLSTILLVTGCSSSKDREMTAVPVEGVTATSIHFTATPVLPSATLTILPTWTVTPSPSPSPSPTTNPAVERRCPEFMGEVAMETVANGTILPIDSPSDQIHLLDLQSGQTYYPSYQLDPNSVESIDFSPNLKYFAYIEHNLRATHGTMWIFDARAKILLKQELGENWYDLRWLDDERLLFKTFNTREQSEVVIFNLNTADYSVVSNELPDFYTNQDMDMNRSTNYSPDLQKVIYIGNSQGDLYLIYRDLVSRHVLWQIPILLDGWGEPIWSPDGRQFVLMAGYDLYIIQIDGKVVDILKKEEFGYFNPYSYGWSPNGKYIGFRPSKQMGAYSTGTLMVYDLESKKVVDYCFDGYSFETPIWSPDSTQLITGSSFGVGGTLIDLPTNRYYKLLDIPDVLYPGAWMYSLPDEE